MLPTGPGEMDGGDTTKHPQMRSRRFLVKSMFMGVVGRSRLDKNFDGRILNKKEIYNLKKNHKSEI